MGDPALSTTAPDSGTFLTNAGTVMPRVTDGGSMLQAPSDPLFTDTGNIINDTSSMTSTPPAPDAASGPVSDT